MNDLAVPDFKQLLAKCLFGGEWESSLDKIVPYGQSQLDPQQLGASCVITYVARNMRRVLHNRTFNYRHLATVRVDLELTAVGIDADIMMQQTLFWDDRSDVRELMAEYNSQLLNTDRIIHAVDWYQDGLNTTMGYTTTLKLVSVLTLEEPKLSLNLKAVLLQGDIISPE